MQNEWVKWKERKENVFFVPLYAFLQLLYCTLSLCIRVRSICKLACRFFFKLPSVHFQKQAKKIFSCTRPAYSAKKMMLWLWWWWWYAWWQSHVPCMQRQTCDLNGITENWDKHTSYYSQKTKKLFSYMDHTMMIIMIIVTRRETMVIVNESGAVPS